jgi:membrane-bound lytic murein transglycosylase D
MSLKRSPASLLLVAVAACTAVHAAAASSPGPDPFAPVPELVRDVEFWKRIYAEVGTAGGLLHDDRHLDVIYEVMAFPPGLSSAARARIVDDAKAKYSAILRTLADGRREDLSGEEQRVLALWGGRATADALANAIGRLRFQLGQSDRFREGLVRSGTWEEHVATTLEAQGLPPEIAALPHVESSFNPLAGSKVGAAGLWQFMPSTGRRWLRVDNVVDERYDPYRATVAAAQLLSLNYSILGTWPLALTAYNHGAAGMRRAKELMGTDDIVTILRYYQSPSFGFASRNFYVSFLAALDVDRNYATYFGSLERNPPEEFRTVRLPDYVPIAALERRLQVDRERLRALNLALRPAVWEGKRLVPRGYELRVPGRAADAELAAMLDGLPSAERYAAQRADAIHTVRRGETLGRIARRHGTSVAWLVRNNQLQSAQAIRPGQVLRLPGEMPLRAAPAAGEVAGAYVVKRGDTLSAIAARNGVTQRDLMNWNGLPSRDAIFEGQRLALRAPDAATVAGPALADEEASELVAAEPRGPVIEPAKGPEPVSREQAAEQSPSLGTATPAGMSADPTDYGVDARGTIVVQAAETLGHYAEWLGVTATSLRQLNRMRKSQALRVGRRLALDLSRVDAREFELRRVAHHRALQQAFFSDFRIAGTERYRVQAGDSIWVITQKHGNVPVWLLRQYNPETDLGDVRAGAELVIPRVVTVAGSGG